MADNKLGRFVWYDLMTPDQEGAKGFYEKVVGWGTMKWDGPMPYTMWTHAPEAALGGLMDLPEEAKAAGAPPHWIGYVSTPDCAATAAKAEQLGGKILKEPTEIPETGTFAVLADPQGVVFAVYQSATGMPEDAPAQLKQFSWHELATTDYEAAFDFYAELFEWSKTEDMDMGEGAIYRMYGFGQWPLGGMYNKPAEMPVSGWVYYVSVPDVNAAAEVVKTEGGQVLLGPMEVPGGDMIAYCVDPQGATFAVHSKA